MAAFHANWVRVGGVSKDCLTVAFIVLLPGTLAIAGQGRFNR